MGGARPARGDARRRDTRAAPGRPALGRVHPWRRPWRSVTPQWAYLDRPVLSDGVGGGDLDRFLEAVALEQVEPAYRLLRLGERAVGHSGLAVAHADRAGASRRRELVSDLPDAPCLQVVDPREWLLLVRRIGGVRLRLGVHS